MNPKLMTWGLLSLAPLARAGAQTRTERVHFAKGATSAVVESSIEGYATVDYLLGARAGQSMNVSLATKHGATYFNIMAPGDTTVALYNGSVAGNQYEGVLPASGDYTIRVYMMRSAARRKETARYRLEMIVAGAGQPAGHDVGDVKVPGTDFHATGSIPCSMVEGQPTGSCDFGVKREGNGNGAVTVTRMDGSPRIIFFKEGRPVGYDQSGGDAGPFSAARESDLNIIRIGQERYEIPDAVVLGG